MTIDNGKRLRAFHEKHLNGIFSKRVNITKLTNLTAKTKHSGQIKLDIDCYLEPLCPLHVTHDVVTLAGSKKRRRGHATMTTPRD